MKRTYTLIAAALMCVAAVAQNAATVKSLNAKRKSIQSEFNETAVSKATNKNKELKGTVYYTADGRLSMIYSEPAGDLKLIAGDKFTQINGGRYMQTNLKQKGPMHLLCAMLINSFAGDVEAIKALSDGTELKESTEGNQYVFEISHKKGIGAISCLTLKYDKTDGTLAYMRIDYLKGKSNTYVLTGRKTLDKAVDDKVFVAPPKPKKQDAE